MTQTVNRYFRWARWLLLLAIVAVVLTMVSCAPNKAWRTQGPTVCPGTGCGDAYIEEHEHYTLGFIEFSERGNEFDRQRTEEIIHRLHAGSESDEGIAIVTFVHGWLHNASSNDSNVQSFRTVLDAIGQAGVMGDRKLYGVYVGWRGKTLHGLKSQYLTYWGRKAVAEHIGYNGVSPLIQRLYEVDERNDNNILFVVGHSFGGAMTLSAVNDVLLSRMIRGLSNHQSVEPLGEGVVLLNPAIEANQALALKEQSMRFGQTDIEQPSLLHIISSEGDAATHVYFPLGQSVAALGWNEIDFTRTYDGRPYHFSEHALDINTIGNYQRFWTAALAPLKKRPEGVLGDYPVGDWEYRDLCQPPAEHQPAKSPLPCTDKDPVKFLITDPSFIKGHSDIFNDKVAAYLTSLVAESIYHKSPFLQQTCGDENGYDFGKCFNYFIDHYAEYFTAPVQTDGI